MYIVRCVHTIKHLKAQGGAREIKDHLITNPTGMLTDVQVTLFTFRFFLKWSNSCLM